MLQGPFALFDWEGHKQAADTETEPVCSPQEIAAADDPVPVRRLSFRTEHQHVHNVRTAGLPRFHCCQMNPMIRHKSKKGERQRLP